MKIRSINKWQRFAFSLGWCIVLIALTAGCGRDKIKLSDVRVNPEEVRPGEQAEVSVTMLEGPSNLSGFSFKWTATNGNIHPDDPNAEPKLSRTYIAPETPGQEDIVTLQVLKGNKTVFMGQKKIPVIGGVAQVPTGTSGTSTPIAPPDRTQSSIFEVSQKFTPSGFMGDGEVNPKSISVVPAFKDSRPGSPIPTCYKWSYKPGKEGWAAVAWQFPQNNFGEKPGKNLTGYSRVTFWVKGDKGGEQLTFKAGGHTNPEFRYQASFEAETDMITLTKDWQRHEIDLSHLPAGQDLSNVPCAFVWVAREMENPDGCTFYLDDIWYEK